MSKNQGKVFEKNFENSINSTDYWSFRVRDVNPAALRNRFMIPKNPYDLMMFDGEYLFTLELKSNQGKSISHRGSNPQIKPHQVEALLEAAEHDNIISGLILNFRSVDKTYFLPITEFLKYDEVSKGKRESNYRSKVNEKSIPLDICKEVGLEILAMKKRVHNHYLIDDFVHTAKREYRRRNWKYEVEEDGS